jgi:pimeloyl-ACP methyl ester carboxylesterase
MRYLYIHGANATSTSFNYIRGNISGNDIVFDYNSANGFNNNLDIMSEKVKNIKGLFVVAHSLGGVYALHLANRFPKNFLGAVTLSTPYCGSSLAEFVRWMMPHSQLFHDITPTSKIMQDSMSMPLQHPWTQVVTTRGAAPWLMEANDGVVTLKSMRARADMELIELELNHYEVVMSPKVVELIRDRSIAWKR